MEAVVEAKRLQRNLHPLFLKKNEMATNAVTTAVL